MHLISCIVLLFFMSMLRPSLCQQLTPSGSKLESRLLNQILSDYDTRVRPTNNLSAPLEVAISAYPSTVLNVDSHQQTVKLSFYMQLIWIDHSIRWNPVDFSGQTSILAPQTLFWFPTYIVEEAIKMYTVPESSDGLVRIQHNGSMEASFSAIFTIGCVFQMRTFPFDEQRCLITLSPPHFTVDEVVLIHATPTNQLKHYNEHVEWELVNFVATGGTTDFLDGLYSVIRYSIVLKRNPGYYIQSIMLPTFMITCLCTVGLFSPHNSAGTREERVTLGLTSLLSMSVMLLMTTQDIPKTNQWTRIGLYLMFEISLAAGGVLIAVGIMCLQVHGPNMARKIMEQRKRGHTDTQLPSANEEQEDANDEVSNILHELTSIRMHLDRYEATEEKHRFWAGLCTKIDYVFMFLLLAANFIYSAIFLSALLV